MLLVPTLSLRADAASLTDAVVEAVRGGVQRRQLVPGQTYSVYQLAELLGVSRSPVREAMLRLAEVGLVEIVRNRGFRVVLPTAHDVEEIFEIVRKLNATEGVSFLLAEQNTNMALKYATYGYILETGRVVMDGPAKMLRENEDVKEFYLGVSGADRRVTRRSLRAVRPRFT